MEIIERTYDLDYIISYVCMLIYMYTYNKYLYYTFINELMKNNML